MRAKLVERDARSCLTLRSARTFDQLVEFLVAHETAHGTVVDEHHRRVRAEKRLNTFTCLQGEQAVDGEVAADLHAQATGEVLSERDARRRAMAKRVDYQTLSLKRPTGCWFIFML